MAQPLPARAVPAPNAVHQTVEGQTVLLDVKAGEYYTLDPVGSFVWERLQAEAEVDAVVTALLERYAVEEDRAREDVGALLRDLEAQGLVTLEP